LLEGGAGGFVWHADAFGRRSDDLRVPGGRIVNSAAESSGGAVGGGWAGAQGYAGLAADTLRNDYGVVVEPDVTIRLKRDRVSAAGEWRSSSGWLRSVALRGGHTDYQHEEVEGSGEIGTTFKSRGDDLRAEARHAPVAGIEGVFGLQAETLRFSALGEEAFVPSTHTRSAAAFVLEEWRSGPWRLSGGLRAEQVRVSAGGPLPARRFEPISAALAVSHTLPAGWALQASLGHTERAPAYYELYADGVHLATAAYEVGDPALALERSRHAELGVAWADPRDGGAHRFKASLFTTRFSNHIALDATGALVDVAEPGDPPELVPEYRFQGVRARLQGLELEGRTRLVQGTWTLDATGALDLVRGSNLSRGEPLPRIAPQRTRLGLEAASGPWSAGAELRHHARQARVSSGDTPTPAYTMLDLWWRAEWQSGIALFAKLSNATDEEAFNATAVATVRALSPLPGRALSAGVSVRW